MEFHLIEQNKLPSNHISGWYVVMSRTRFRVNLHSIVA